jgi:hypothetical protein
VLTLILGITSKEVSELVKAMTKEAGGEVHYMRIDLIAAVGRKPDTPRFPLLVEDIMGYYSRPRSRL